MKVALAKVRDANFEVLCETIKKTAFKITRVGQLVAQEASKRMGIPFGIIDLSLAPTPSVGDSVAEILEEIGLERVGAPAVGNLQRHRQILGINLTQEPLHGQGVQICDILEYKHELAHILGQLRILHVQLVENIPLRAAVHMVHYICYVVKTAHFHGFL